MADVVEEGGQAEAPAPVLDGNPPEENNEGGPALDPLTAYLLMGSAIDREITLGDTNKTILTMTTKEWTEKTGGESQFSSWSLLILCFRFVVVW